MKNMFYVIFLLVTFVSCKSDSKKEKPSKMASEEQVTKTPEKVKTYEDILLDLRPVNKNFNDDFVIEKFGVERINDSIYKLVLKLNPLTSNETVLKYSIGVKGVNNTTHSNKLLAVSSPEIEEIDENNYIKLRSVLPNTQYFDSLYFYIYERKNWKGSGKLGGFWIRDVLLIEE